MRIFSEIKKLFRFSGPDQTRRYRVFSAGLAALAVVAFGVWMFAQFGASTASKQSAQPGEPQANGEAGRNLNDPARSHDIASAIADLSSEKEQLAHILGDRVRRNEWPAEIDFRSGLLNLQAKVQYTFLPQTSSQARMEKLIGQYRPDYAAFVAMDARTGKILSMVSFSAVHPEMGNLAVRATFPAASVFKIVTASAALDTQRAEPDTVVSFSGANHTLYRKNVEDRRENRWTRHVTMREAFARSINTVFAKLGLFYVGGENLKKYAERFYFNRHIPADIAVDMGAAPFDIHDSWGVISTASGFTRETTMSPLHGALLAAAVANEGVMMEPYVVESLKSETGNVLYQATPRKASVVFEPRTALSLRELFSETVHSGTSRKSFRQTIRRPAFEDVEFGGKTGSLTGLNPAGKCDWFVGYALYQGQRIAVGALTVNEKKWKVKASALANAFFTGYLADLRKKNGDRYVSAK
jgi:cell division protein FtsI/penicillin-binding protein 2